MAVTAEGSATKQPLVLGTPNRWRGAWVPWLWIGPAVAFVVIFLVYPVVSTLWLSLYNFDSTAFVFLDNYRHIFTDRNMLVVLRNNIIWLILGTAFTVFLGLVIAMLADRVRIESLVKSAIFIPMAISFVGAGVIWNFMYQFTPAGTTQTGLLNALVTRIGLAPQAWLIDERINNLALIAVYVWMWTGFCMVILSAALKGVPTDVIEAARMDGASELNIFFRVIVPMISPTIAVVATTMVINVLKIFDIVYVMTGGNFNTSVVAYEYYRQAFNFNDFGISSALAVVLLLAVIPIIYFNIRRFRAQEAER